MKEQIEELEQKVIEEKLLGVSGDAAGAFGEGVNPAMLDQLDRMNRTAVNRSYRAIPGSSALGKIKRAFKRLLRRMMFWYVEPCMMQQTEFNSASAAFSAQTNQELNQLRCKSVSMDDRLAEITLYTQAMEQSMKRAMRDLQESQRELEELSEQILGQVQKHGGTVHVDTWRDRKVSSPSYSQAGEDAILRYVFRSVRKDLSELSYLDLGANHAKFLSNTYSFYQEGAHGVLVEANPALIEELQTTRPRDTVVNRCIAKTADTQLTFYVMSGDGLSTMDYEAVQSFLKENPSIHVERTVTVPSITIPELIQTYFPDKAPDLVNLDIEGMELDVLKSMDFRVFRPFAIICEMIDYKVNLEVPEKNQEILEYLQKQGYEEYAFTGINSIFIDRAALEGEGK